jgi:hypothetical protein
MKVINLLKHGILLSALSGKIQDKHKNTPANAGVEKTA